MMTGNFYPVQRPRRRTTPALERKKVFTTGRNFTELKVYVHTPTLQYPESSIFLQLANVKGSCFMRFENPSELRDLQEFLSEVSQEVDACVTNLEPIKQQVISQLNQFSESMKNLELIKKMGGISGNGVNEED